MPGFEAASGPGMGSAVADGMGLAESWAATGAIGWVVADSDEEDVDRAADHGDAVQPEKTRPQTVSNAAWLSFGPTRMPIARRGVAKRGSTRGRGGEG
jgi:hypothetical protein